MKRMLSLLLALAGGGFAQDAAPLRLSLRDAVSLALKENPQVILANLDVGQSEQERLIARSTLLPQINGNISEAAHRVNLEAAIGFRFPNSPQHVGPYYTFQAGASFQAPVFDLSLWRRYHAAQFGVEASREQELSVREESVLLVVSQYLGGQRAAADVEAAQSRMDLAQALYNQAVDLQRSGVGTGIDALRANVQLQNETQRLIYARTQLDTSLFALARLLSVDPSRKLELADQIGADTSVTPADQTIEQAYATRPELRQISTQMRQAELALQSAGEQRLPRVSVNGYWVQMGLRPGNVIPAYQYQASLDIPLFTGGRIQAQRAEADIAIRQLRQRERELKNRIALEVKTATAQLESARNEVQVANQGVDLARQEVTQARDRFEAGVANNIEVITAQDALARSSDNQIAALYRFNQSRADLAHAVGRMELLYGK